MNCLWKEKIKIQKKGLPVEMSDQEAFLRIDAKIREAEGIGKRFP